VVAVASVLLFGVEMKNCMLAPFIRFHISESSGYGPPCLASLTVLDSSGFNYVVILPRLGKVFKHFPQLLAVMKWRQIYRPGGGNFTPDHLVI
jgi:hypothetical protein